jgi:hypothetical protein
MMSPFHQMMREDMKLISLLPDFAHSKVRDTSMTLLPPLASSSPAWPYAIICTARSNTHTYRVLSKQADWTSTHTSHKDTEQGTAEASITLDGITWTNPLITRSPNERPSVCQEIPQRLPIRFSGRLISLQNEHPIFTCV